MTRLPRHGLGRPSLRGLLMAGTGLLAPLALAPGALAQSPGDPGQTGALSAFDTDRNLQLAPDSPFRDPDLIYLEANEVINDEREEVLTAIGEVEGRYEDRTIRADRVDYDLKTGIVLATGNVVLISANGDLQYADKIELSGELEAGAATNFTARLASGATTAARFVARDEAGEVELYNVVYTACEICEDKSRPTWRLKARRLQQDTDTNTIRYKDAVLEVFGLPVMYLPFFAHPDPTQDRASGLLFPTISLSESRGFTYAQPYYWAVDDYTELTVTPRIFSGVNPLLGATGRRKYATGEISMAGSITREILFDNQGRSLDDPALFVDPAQAESGAVTSGHFFVDGYFKPSDTWHYGYTAMWQSDDTYRDRYGLLGRFQTNGLVEEQPRTNTSQAFVTGQGENFRLSVMAASFQSLRTQIARDATTDLIRVISDDGGRLPVIAPIVDGEYYVSDPVVGGTLRLDGNISYLTRQDGDDYGRATLGADYSKVWVAPGGVEVKPFVWSRFDSYDIQTVEDSPLSFSRLIGQAGIDLRYPFVRYGRNVNVVIEPRIQATESFGDAELENFLDPISGRSALEDGATPDLDASILFEANKADGYDFFEEGRRLDIGANVSARWKMNGRDASVSVFAGQSFSDGVDNQFARQTGLQDRSSDYVATVEVNLAHYLRGRTLVRYDAGADELSRIDAEMRFDLGKVRGVTRYYRLSDTTADLLDPNAVQEVITGGLSVHPTDSLSARYNVSYDLGRGELRTHRAAMRLEDDCTLLEFYFRRNNTTNILLNDTEVGFSIALKTLGGVGAG
ncbi:MAG: LPS assembly protein LptD [Litorimonas sp.]